MNSDSSSDEPLALALALRALAQKERSVAELGDWLRKRGIDDVDADDAVRHLIEIGTLDDARFARRYAEDKRELAGWGSDRIRVALLSRGIDPADADPALAAADADAGDLERAVELLRLRGGNLADDRTRNRALGLLVRRGYDADTAYEAIRTVESGSA